MLIGYLFVEKIEAEQAFISENVGIIMREDWMEQFDMGRKDAVICTLSAEEVVVEC